MSGETVVSPESYVKGKDVKNMAETLGARLRRLRTAAGLTQQGMAAKCAVPQGTYRNWEYDLRAPTVPGAMRLANGLGIALEQLYRGLSKSPPRAVPVPGRKRGRPRMAR